MGRPCSGVLACSVLALFGLPAAIIVSCNASDTLATAGGTTSSYDGTDASGIPLVREQPEAPGPHCPNGGTAISVGLDSNGDGVLEDGEVTSTTYVCNSLSPDAGQAANALVSVKPEAPGTNCPYGGQIIQTGLDVNSNGQLDPGEVMSTAYVCAPAPIDAGVSGPPLVTVTPEPAGANCASGGQAIQSGIDLNADGVLEPNEITATAYVCNATPAGGVLQGSYVIHNTVDAAILGLFAGITGDLTIDAPGVTDIQLPSLLTIGGSLIITNNNLLTSISFPNLTSAGAVSMAVDVPVVELPALSHLTSAAFTWFKSPNLTLPSLVAAVGDLMFYPSTQDAVVELPLLTDARIVYFWEYSLINAPMLANAQEVNIKNIASGTMPVAADLHSVNGAAISVYATAVTQVDLSGLTTVSNVLSANNNGIGIYIRSLNANAVALPSLQQVAGIVELDVDDIAMPALTNAGLSISGSMSSLSLPSFMHATAVQLTGSLAALDLPVLATVDGGFAIQGSALVNISLPALALVGGDMQIVNNPMLSAMNEPTLNSVGGFLTISNNSQLATLSLPMLTSVGQQFQVLNNVNLPQCVVDAIEQQLVANGFNPASYYTGGNSQTCP